ncbi:hypothetical protein ACFVH7_29540 [Kitasatospora indigofera]|uniref:hypothetical protein n=1 Tax=Kitasatospora indigofera TaxID=67307 RepID=UPI0036449D91
MQVHRSAHARNFIVLPNAAVQDRRLSLAARGLLADLLSRPERWREDARQIADSSIDSRAAVRKALKELIVAGYYRVEKVRMPDGTIRSEAHVYDTPQLPGLKAAEKLLGTAKPQVKPRVARPASGVPDSGAAGVLVVRNLVKEPSLPAPDRGDVEGRRRTEPSVRHPRPAGGRVAPSMDDLVGPPRVAALALYRVLKDQPRLRLGDAEVVELAPLVERWLAAGCGPAELAAALLPGLPSEIYSPVAVIRDRLVRKLPPAPSQMWSICADQQHECVECRVPVSTPGLCGRCSGLSGPSPAAFGCGEPFTAAGAAKARAAMRGTAALAR